MRGSVHRTRGRAGCVVALVALAASAGVPAGETPVNWDLSEIYADRAAWDAAREGLAADVAKLDRFKGRLGESAATLRDALAMQFDLQRQAARLSSYASMLSDEDTRESVPQGMRQTLQALFADLGAATSWIDPEILEIPQATLGRYLREEAGLADYARYLERLEKRRPHVLERKGEEIMGLAQRIRGDGSSIGNLLRNAEMPWPTITLSDGTSLRLDSQGYTRGRSSSNRADRIATYDAFYAQLQAFKGTLASALSSTVQEHVFEARVRGYGSSLEAALADNEVDPAVYRMLVREINQSLPVLQRYLKLRGRILGIDDLRYYDLCPPLVETPNADYRWDNAKRLVVESLAPLGSEYTSRLARALDAGWVDVHPRPGKRAGAYVNGSVYDLHPYMLLNHQDDYNSTSTLAHEAGHLMHSWYSNEAQPYPNAGYVIFVAEVASTVNEVIMFRNMVAAAADDDERLALLGSFLDGLRGTVFRQTQFAEFELAIHEAAERGEPLTGDTLNAMYLALLRKYHGQDQGVITIDEPFGAEWAFVPHFHYNFYVYQYATSYVAAIGLAEGILEDRPGARASYLAFLKSGATKPPVELLADAGVDMTSPEPIRAAMRLMNEVMDRIDEVLARRTQG
jgi:oligoendopeptidase F